MNAKYEMRFDLDKINEGIQKIILIVLLEFKSLLLARNDINYKNAKTRITILQ
jgi:hypothetical protein